MNKEEIKEICKLQHKDIIYKVLISKMPIAYTSFDAHNLERDMKIRNDYEENQKELYKMVEKVGMKKIEETFGNPEIMKKEENRFTYDDQRKATKEVIDKELTLEEFFEKYKV